VYQTRIQEERFPSQEEANKYRGGFRISQSIYNAHCKKRIMTLEITKRKRQTMLVVSLPGSEGDNLKEALQKMATENSRSLSNQAMIILREFLLKEERL